MSPVTETYWSFFLVTDMETQSCDLTSQNTEEDLAAGFSFKDLLVSAIRFFILA